MSEHEHQLEWNNKYLTTDSNYIYQIYRCVIMDCHYIVEIRNEINRGGQHK